MILLQLTFIIRRLRFSDTQNSEETFVGVWSGIDVECGRGLEWVNRDLGWGDLLIGLLACNGLNAAVGSDSIDESR